MSAVYLPESLDDVWCIMDAEPDARVYAGGTDLLVLWRRGLIKAATLICIERVEEIRGIREEGDEVVIGAATPLAQVLADPLVCKHLSILGKAIEVLASPPIRHMGTIGGNIVNASPAGDTLAPLHILRASLEVRSRTEKRSVPIAGFITGPGQVEIEPHELLTHIRIPKPEGFGIHHYEKVGRRKGQACAVASMAALVALSQDGIVEDIRLAWGSVGPTVVGCIQAENAIKGKPLIEESLQQAAPIVRETVEPIDDVRAYADYRRVVSGNLLLRLERYGSR